MQSRWVCPERLAALGARGHAPATLSRPAWGSQAEGAIGGLSLCPNRGREGAFDSTQGNRRESSLVWPQVFHGVGNPEGSTLVKGGGKRRGALSRTTPQSQAASAAL